jgi:NAD(P)-dependent dehydrogenase (short-subunit alcohol dehydrogenase family)
VSALPRFDAHLLAGRTLLVTGASSGIGRAVASMAASCGARIVAAGRSLERLDATLAQLAGSGHAAEVAPFESADQVADWCKSTAARAGGLDGIFHGAGVEVIRPLRMLKNAQVAEAFAGSTFAAFGLCRAAASKDVMREAGGAVVLMSSVAGLRGTAGMTAYGAAKAAIDGLVRGAACELSPRRIRVNSLAAGGVRTEMHDRLATRLDAAGVAEYEGRHLLGFGSPDDVAGTAVFLLSDLGRWVTGATWVVDGGYSVR